MAVNETETHEPLYPRAHPYSPSSGIGTPDEVDVLEARVKELELALSDALEMADNVRGVASERARLTAILRGGR